MKRMTWLVGLGFMALAAFVVGCTDADECGNGSVGGSEVCDGTDLNGNDCTTVGGNFSGGTLTCAADCFSFDTTNCITDLCGNDQVDGTEDCDGTELDGESCTSMGFTGGTLACNNDCSFDLSGCTGGGG